MEAKHHQLHAQQNHSRHPYVRLLVMGALSFVCMYVLMYAMVNSRDNVYLNMSQVYMAGLMTAPMILIELAVMRGMYRDKKRNIAFIAAGFAALAGSWMLIRRQAAVGDSQFLRSMIPHHAGALLMCNEASIIDPEIRALCENIKAGQQSEIEQMKRVLERLNARGQGGAP